MLQVLLAFLVSAYGLVTQAAPVYVLQDGTPVAVANFVQPEAGCNWLGVGGQVFDRHQSPVEGLLVRVSGQLEGNTILQYALTGGSLQFGPGGYEIALSDHLIASQGSLNLQLMDLAGRPLSVEIPLQTFANCQKNLVIINLIERMLEYNNFIPLIYW